MLALHLGDACFDVALERSATHPARGASAAEEHQHQDTRGAGAAIAATSSRKCHCQTESHVVGSLWCRCTRARLRTGGSGGEVLHEVFAGGVELSRSSCVLPLRQCEGRRLVCHVSNELRAVRPPRFLLLLPCSCSLLFGLFPLCLQLGTHIIMEISRDRNVRLVRHLFSILNTYYRFHRHVVTHPLNNA